MGFDHRFEFFEKDPVPAWEHNGFTDFYTALIRLRHENPALAAGVVSNPLLDRCKTYIKHIGNSCWLL